MIFLPDARLEGIDAETAAPNPTRASLPASRVVGQTKSCSILVHLQLNVLWTVVLDVLVDPDATPFHSYRRRRDDGNEGSLPNRPTARWSSSATSSAYPQ